jgi:hypothetical protein
MGVFDKIFNRKAGVATASPSTGVEVECPHIVLTGRWDSVQDMGKDELATAFICGACRQTFTPEEARMLRETTAERLHTEDIERARAAAEGETPPG